MQLKKSVLMYQWILSLTILFSFTINSFGQKASEEISKKGISTKNNFKKSKHVIALNWWQILTSRRELLYLGFLRKSLHYIHNHSDGTPQASKCN